MPITETRPAVHVRLPKELVKQVDLVGVFLELDRARATEYLLGVAFACLRGHGWETGLSALIRATAPETGK